MHINFHNSLSLWACILNKILEVNLTFKEAIIFITALVDKFIMPGVVNTVALNYSEGPYELKVSISLTCPTLTER